MQRRVLWLFTLSIIVFAVLFGRLFVLSVFPDRTQHIQPIRWQAKVRAKADLEHFRVLQVDDGRGRILFRNGLPWSGREQRIALSTHPVDAGTSQKEIETFVHREDVTLQDPVIGEVGKPDIWPGTRVVPEQGRSGLELTLDKYLQARRPGYLARLRDVLGRIKGTSLYAVSVTPGASVRTTIDPAWQWLSVQSLRSAGVHKGAIVVLDLPTNQVLALANRNVANPAEITAVKAQVPGSVFKIVTSTAALESFEFTSRSRFLCLGHTVIPGVSMNCWTVHGRENLREAFAGSCDVAFAEIGTKIQRKALDITAAKLGLETTGLQRVDGAPVLRESEPGRVFAGDSNDNGTLANTAIGQQDVRLSPLQAALLSAAVANGGAYRPVQLVKDLEVNNVPVHYFSQPASSQAMSPLTAATIASYMRLAVTSPKGTAHGLATLPVSAGVKTGTAEIGKGRVNGWITGFAPSTHPRIAFSVYVGDEDEQTAHQQVFAMTRSLLLAYNRFFPAKASVQALSQ